VFVTLLLLLLCIVLCVNCDMSCSTIPNWLFKRNFQMRPSFGVLMSGERRIAFLAIMEVGVCLPSITIIII